MRVVDAYRRRVLDEARLEVVRLAGAGAALAVLTVVLVAVAAGAAGPLAGLAGMAAWVAVGVSLSEATNALGGGVLAWRTLRRLRSNDAYLVAVVEVVAAQDRAELVRLGGQGEPPAGAR